MFLHARNMPDAIEYYVIDQDTECKIPRVIWANDETGYYEQVLVGEDGQPIVVQNISRDGKKVYGEQILTDIKRGNIPFVKVIPGIDVNINELWEIRWRQRG